MDLRLGTLSRLFSANQESALDYLRIYNNPHTFADSSSPTISNDSHSNALSCKIFELGVLLLLIL